MASSRGEVVNSEILRKSRMSCKACVAVLGLAVLVEVVWVAFLSYMLWLVIAGS